MVMEIYRSVLRRVIGPALFGLSLFGPLGPLARAQEPADAPAYENSAPNDSTGPVRLARFSVVIGQVSWRPEIQDEWSSAEINLPIRQGTQVWVPEGSRAEIQFDDGSNLRLGSRALITLQTMYSDADGEFTQISLKDGAASLRLQHDQ